MIDVILLRLATGSAVHIVFDVLQMTGMQLAAAAINEQSLHEVGGDEPTMRTMSRAEANARTPSEELRPTAHKMMLRPHEQDQLPLVRHTAHNTCL